jgi:hypothetical protein
MLLAERVSPFGHRRVKACCQLTDAFRRLPRPSSPLTAKASTVCAWSLDPIAPTLTGQTNRSQPIALLASTTRWYRSHAPPVSRQPMLPQRLLHPPCQRTSPGLNTRQPNLFVCASLPVPPGGASRDRTGDPLLAKQVLSQLSYGPPIGLVGLGGLEPPTSPLSGVRSNHLSYRPNQQTENVAPATPASPGGVLRNAGHLCGRP